MPDRTREFREVAEARASSSSGSSARNNAASVNPARAEALRRIRKRKRAQAEQAAEVDMNDPDLDLWTLEAGRVVDSLRSLSTFLSSIRRAYLDFSSSSSSSHNQYRNSKGKGSAGGREELDLSKGLLVAWKDVKWLNDRERDEVDWQAKDLLRKCMERVKALEQAEKSKLHFSTQLGLRILTYVARPTCKGKATTRHQSCKQFYSFSWSTACVVKSGGKG